ncbi:MAG: GNAT family N-acetyltransferase [Acidimicrobiales bacterium]
MAPPVAAAVVVVVAAAAVVAARGAIGQHGRMIGPPERLDAGPVVLRRYVADDAVALAEAVNASLEHLRPWMPWAQSPATASAMAAFIGCAAAAASVGTEYQYGVFGRDGAVVVGGCGLHARSGPGSLDIGYWVHAGHVGRGIATACAAALTEAALALPGITRVEIHCDVANTASAAVARKLGFRLDRVEERPVTAPGETGRQMIWVSVP